jgi:glycosyltransferase involved in cell wall biosynthesis
LLNTVDTATEQAAHESAAQSRASAVTAAHAPARAATDESIALVFVGSIVPDEPRWSGPSFNAAAQMFQRELLLGLAREGLPASLVIASQPVPSRRHAKRLSLKHLPLFVRGCSSTIATGTPLRLVPFINITPLKQLTIGLATAFELLRWGWRNRAARHRVVYSYNLSVPPGAFTLLAARLIRAKTVVSLCDIEVPGETVPGGPYWKFDHALQRRLIPRFDGHTVASQAIADDFLRGRSALRLEGGVSDKLLDQTANAAPPLQSMRRDPREFVIVIAGQLGELNGIPLLLDAFSRLRGDHFRLRIAGAGPLEHHICAAAARDPRIEFLGRLPLDRVLETYASADVLLNLRITRSLNTKYFFPSKMMEYLVSGVPVISTCTGHVEEEFGAFTFLLRDETPEALAQLIERVAALDPADRRAQAARARAYMAAKKTWRAQTQKLAHYIRASVLKITEPS